MCSVGEARLRPCAAALLLCVAGTAGASARNELPAGPPRYSYACYSYDSNDTSSERHPMIMQNSGPKRAWATYIGGCTRAWQR